MPAAQKMQDRIDSFILAVNTASEFARYTKMVYKVPDYLNIDVHQKWKDIKPEELQYYRDHHGVETWKANPNPGQYGPAAKRTLLILLTETYPRNFTFTSKAKASAYVRQNLAALETQRTGYENLFG